MSFYNWEKTFSYQTGTNGEHCFIIGAKNIGKTYGLRKFFVKRFLKNKELFCAISRTDAERKEISQGYFSKLEENNEFPNYIFRTDKFCAYIAKKPAKEKEKPKWELIGYFIALTTFQRDKQRTYKRPMRFVFDEAIIDTKDKYHRYLKDEYFILANLLDTVSRQQPNDDDYNFKVYYLANAVDLTCPLLQYFGINKIPKFGYSYYKNKTVLLHYVEPWDSDVRKEKTLVGRMLNGYDESQSVFDNIFTDSTGKEIAKKPSSANYKYSIKWGNLTFAIWSDYKSGIYYINSKTPIDSKRIYTLSKKDSSINYQAIDRVSPLLKIIKDIYFLGAIRYESAFIRESFFEILGYIGIF